MSLSEETESFRGSLIKYDYFALTRLILVQKKEQFVSLRTCSLHVFSSIQPLHYLPRYRHRPFYMILTLPSHASEVDLAQLTSIPSAKIKVPGIAEAKIRMDCTLDQSLALACDLIIGRVVCFHIAEELYKSGHIDAQLLKPVSRLAGNNYSKLGEIFSVDRPN